MFSRLAWAVTQFPRRTIVIVALIAAVALIGLKNTHFVSDFDSTLPNRSYLTQQILQNQHRFGARNTLAFLISGRTSAERTQAACALTQALATTPGISAQQIFGPGSDNLKMLRQTDAGLEVVGLSRLCDAPDGLTAQATEWLGPQGAMLRARDGELIVTADVTLTSGQFDHMLSALDRQIAGIEKSGVRIAYSGQPAFLAQNDKFSKRIAYFFPVIMFLVLLLHWEALRSVQAVVIPIFTGLSATLVALGIYGWMHMVLDTYTVLAPILILAVGAGHSVQLLKRYMEEVRLRTAVGERPSRKVNAAAVRATVEAMGPVLLFAVVGASACLFALLLLDVAALARFGLLAGIGIIAALVLELTVVPAMRMLLPRGPMREQFGELSRPWRITLQKVCDMALNWPARRVTAVLGVIAIIIAGGVMQVHSSHSMSVYTAPDVPVQRTLQAFKQVGVGPYSFDVAIDTGTPDGAFDERYARLAISLGNMLRRDQDVTAAISAPAIIGFIRCKFDDAPGCDPNQAGATFQARQIWTVMMGNAHSAGLLDADGRYIRVRAFTLSDESVASARLIDKTRQFAREHGIDVTFGGSAVTAKALADGIVRVSLEKAMLLVAVVFLLGGVVFRSLKMAALFAIPAITTIGANFAYLGWTGTSLNVATAAVATIAVGVGLDYLIYLTFRMREAQEQGHDYIASIRIAHNAAGGAAVCVAMAVAVGYAVLIFSPGYMVHHWIAVLVPTTMLISLFGALVIFPFLLRIFRPALIKDQDAADAPYAVAQTVQ